jgi:hypothetical protein
VTNPFDVKVSDDGMLLVFGGRWKQVEPMLFVRADGRQAGKYFLGFKESSKGEISYMFQLVFLVYEKVEAGP